MRGDIFLNNNIIHAKREKYLKRHFFAPRPILTYKSRASLVESDRTSLPGRSVIGRSLQNYPYVWALCQRGLKSLAWGYFLK